MKKPLLIVLLLTTMLICSNVSFAQDRTFGIGTALGGPDGLSYKYWLGETTAFTGLVSFSIADNNSRFYTHLDFLQHKFYDDLEWDNGRVYYYYGGGIGYEWLDITNDNYVTIRLPSGMGVTFDDIPVEGYMELAPTFNIAPEFRFRFVGNFGFRYYLN